MLAKVPDYQLALVNDSVPYPAFDTNGLTLVLQTDALTALSQEAGEKLLNAYNRVRSFNGKLADYSELAQGGTATLFHVIAATSADENGSLPSLVRAIDRQYKVHKASLVEALLDRLANAKEHVEEAVDAVKPELGIHGQPPASRIVHVASEPSPIYVPDLSFVEPTAADEPGADT